jgi:hypothetical protein
VADLISARDDEGQPRLGQLQIDRVHGGRHHLRYLTARCTRSQLGSDLSQPMPRSNLSRAALVDKSTCTQGRRRPNDRPFRAKAIEPRLVDGFKRELRLKARLRSREELSRSRQGALTLQTHPVALEAQGLAPHLIAPACNYPPPLSSAGGAQRFRAFAFQFASWKANPFLISYLR